MYTNLNRRFPIGPLFSVQARTKDKTKVVKMIQSDVEWVGYILPYTVTYKMANLLDACDHGNKKIGTINDAKFIASKVLDVISLC